MLITVRAAISSISEIYITQYFMLLNFTNKCGLIKAVHPNVIQLEQHTQWWMC